MTFLLFAWLLNLSRALLQVDGAGAPREVVAPTPVPHLAPPANVPFRQATQPLAQPLPPRLAPVAPSQSPRDVSDGRDGPDPSLGHSDNVPARASGGPLEPGRRRYFFVGGSSGWDGAGPVNCLRFGLVPLPELALELNVGIVFFSPYLGGDVRVRPLARFSALTPTVRYGLMFQPGVSANYGGPISQAFAAGLEWNYKSGFSIGIDGGARLISNNLASGAFGVAPNVQLYIGHRL